MSRIVLFLGSTRDGRNGERVAKHLVKLLEEKKHSVNVFGKHMFQKSHNWGRVLCQRKTNE